jgi:hypothetical protein
MPLFNLQLAVHMGCCQIAKVFKFLQGQNYYNYLHRSHRPRYESIPATVTSTPPVFGSPLATAPIRVSVTSVPTSRATCQQQFLRPTDLFMHLMSHLPIILLLTNTIYSSNSTPLTFLLQKLGVERSRSDRSALPLEKKRRFAQQQIQQQLQQQPIHSSMLRDLRTPPPAHQHSQSNRHVTSQILLQHQLYQQFYLRHHPDFTRMETFSPGPASQHALNSFEAADLQRDPRESVVTPSLPSHLSLYLSLLL